MFENSCSGHRFPTLAYGYRKPMFLNMHGNMYASAFKMQTPHFHAHAQKGVGQSRRKSRRTRSLLLRLFFLFLLATTCTSTRQTMRSHLRLRTSARDLVRGISTTHEVPRPPLRYASPNMARAFEHPTSAQQTRADFAIWATPRSKALVSPRRTQTGLVLIMCTRNRFSMCIEDCSCCCACLKMHAHPPTPPRAHHMHTS